MVRQLVLSALIALPLSASAQTYVPAHERDQGLETGTELVMVYIGASHCGPCVQPAYKAALERAKGMLSEQAGAEGKGFAVIGVAIDYGAEDGYQFLRDSGGFDELVIGRNWFNSAALAHLWRPEGLSERTVGLPSILVFERDMQMGAQIGASEPRYLKHLVGGHALPEWVAAGAPLADAP